MANDQIFKYYKDLPQWAKGVVVVGGLGIAYILGTTLYKKLFPTPPAQELLNINNDIAKFSTLYKPTYADSIYDQYANTIYNAQAHSVGYDSGAIEDTMMAMMNDLDVAKLIAAYGERQDYNFAIPGDKFTLFGAVKKGITNDYFGVFSYRLGRINTDWASKGITYKV